NMSHELRTPLNSIIGFSGIMLQRMAGDLNDEQEKQLGMVYRSGKHLLDLINGILDISKIEAGRVDVESSTFDLSSLLQEVVGSLQPQALEKDLVLDLTLPDQPVHPHTDRTKVRQVLSNLVGNAVKFTKEGRVDVTLESDDEYFRISVRDTGAGIAKEDRLLIFDEFQQASRRADDKPVGTGLGLAISRKLARMMGGDVELESTVDVGSVFTLRTPIVFKATNKEVDDDNGCMVTDGT
nr:HAMP domain-containing sensor histidine kinase [Actinomycetota bacterium]